MANQIVCIWAVNNMEHEINSGFVVTVDWSCTARNQLSPEYGTVENQNYKPPVYGNESAFYGGQTKYKLDLSKQGFIPYDQLTKEIVLGWVFTDIGDKKTEIEAERIAKVEKQLNPILSAQHVRYV